MLNLSKQVAGIALLILITTACNRDTKKEKAAPEVEETPTYEYEDEDEAEYEEEDEDEEAPAIIHGVELEPAVLRTGDSPRADVSADDDITLRYRWNVNGDEGNLQSSPNLGRKLKRGDEVYVIIEPSRAGILGKTSQSETYVVQNAAPVYQGKIGGGFNLNGHRFKVRDPDNDPLTYALSGAPPGLSINSSTGELSWVGESGGADQNYEVVMTATDPEGAEVSITFPVRITGGG